MATGACGAPYLQRGDWIACQLPTGHEGRHAVMIEVHTLNVFNALDVPEGVCDEVMRLLAPYDPDAYTRDCDPAGRVLGAGFRPRVG